MQDDLKNKEEHNFNNFSEEIEHIHEQVEKNESAQELQPSPENRKETIVGEVSKYKERPIREVLHPDFQMQVDEIQEKIIHLSPEHDKQVDELVNIMGEKGLKNTLAILERLGNDHIKDDFHRFLVQYIAQGLEVKGLKEGTPMFKALNMRLFEVTLPEFSGENKGSFSELVRAMEQFYIGMMSLEEDDKVMNHFTIELARSNYSTDLVFYAAIPKSRAGLFEKQLLSAFPHAAISERKEDYNPFNENGFTAASVAELSDHKGFPLKTFEEFEQDPLNVILGTFSKLNKDGEGASIQLSIAPSGREDVNHEFNEAVKRLKDGEILSQAFEGTGRRVTREIFSMVSDAFNTKTKKDDDEKMPDINQEAIDKISDKMTHSILRTNLRLVVSSGTNTRAEQILGEIESAFNQFSKQQSNELIFKRRHGAKLKQLLHNYSFRLFEEKEELLLNVHELTTMLHFPVMELSTPELKSSRILTAPAPISMPEDGVLLGLNNHRGNETEVRMGKEDRVRHFYVIGQTGTGKTVLLKNMIVQDIMNGHGVCYMDPHGTDIEDILAAIPENRMDDVIYFDPSDMERPMGLNMLEYDVNKPEQKAFVVNEMLSIFNKLFDMKTAGGPMFEQYFRNSTMLVIEDPESGNTLLEIVRVLADEDFRKMKLSKCKNQIVKQFWEEIAGKAGGEASLANMVPYITNKFDVFLSNDIMRLIIAQEKSSFNIREVMDNRKILLVNLAKGRLGDINSHLIGLIMVGKILMAALGRVDAHGTTPADFYLYIDEFQNVTTDSISAILSEARKYRLSLTIAHQYISQIPEDIKAAVFGNVGSKAAFRVSSEDAQFLETQFAPEFSAKDIMKIPNWNAYVTMLVNGFPAKPFNMATLPPPEGIPGRADQVKQLSKQKYGRDRAELEKMVSMKFASMKKEPEQISKPVSVERQAQTRDKQAQVLTPQQKMLRMEKQQGQTRMVQPNQTTVNPATQPIKRAAQFAPIATAKDVQQTQQQGQTPIQTVNTDPIQSTINSQTLNQQQSTQTSIHVAQQVPQTPPSVMQNEPKIQVQDETQPTQVFIPPQKDEANIVQIETATSIRDDKYHEPISKIVTPPTTPKQVFQTVDTSQQEVDAQTTVQAPPVTKVTTVASEASEPLGSIQQTTQSASYNNLQHEPVAENIVQSNAIQPPPVDSKENQTEPKESTVNLTQQSLANVSVPQYGINKQTQSVTQTQEQKPPTESPSTVKQDPYREAIE